MWRRHEVDHRDSTEMQNKVLLSDQFSYPVLLGATENRPQYRQYYPNGEQDVRVKKKLDVDIGLTTCRSSKQKSVDSFTAGWTCGAS